MVKPGSEREHVDVDDGRDNERLATEAGKGALEIAGALDRNHRALVGTRT